MKPSRFKMKMALTAALIGTGTLAFYACINPAGSGYGLTSSGDPIKAGAVAGCPDTTRTASTTDTSSTPVSFANAIQPIFTAKCISCHNGTNVTGLDLRTGNSYASLVNSQKTFEASTKSPYFRVVPGNPDCSYLIEKISSSTPKNGVRMPAGGPYLSASDIDLLRQWIQHGAPQ